MRLAASLARASGVIPFSTQPTVAAPAALALATSASGFAQLSSGAVGLTTAPGPPSVSEAAWPVPRRAGTRVYRMVSGSVNDRELIRQLPQIHRTFDRPTILVWDNLGSRRSRRMRAFAERVDRLSLVFLPPYSPDPNPVEGGWAHLRNGRLANLGARTLDEPVTVARRGLRDIQHRPALLSGFLAATDLTW
ncbi:transposase [Streptomyces sp. SID3343]|uniref:transposase n=1 Tax=Streptomyces sp. SID3343 TaxID=2690260 RepID=UPI001F33E54B|nr:transposase [Streptomyces sp. SID3343]